MARKIVNRKALRDEVAAADAAEAAEAGAATEKPKKKPAKRKSRAKEPVDVRVKLVWRVFNPSMKCVAVYDYFQKKEADARAESLSQAGKTPHFVQKDRVTIEG